MFVDSHLVGQELLYTCHEGYQFADGNISKFSECQPTREWQILYNETCQRKTTTTIVFVSDHIVKCMSAYCLVLEMYMPAFLFAVVSCPIPEALNISYLNTSVPSDPVYNTSILYACVTGYKFHDNDTMKSSRCLANEQWEATDNLLCISKNYVSMTYDSAYTHHLFID